MIWRRCSTVPPSASARPDSGSPPRSSPRGCQRQVGQLAERFRGRCLAHGAECLFDGRRDFVHRKRFVLAVPFDDVETGSVHCSIVFVRCMSFAGGQARDRKTEICLAEKLGRRGRRVCARADRTGPRRCLLACQLPKAEIRFSCPAGLLTDSLPSGAFPQTDLQWPVALGSAGITAAGTVAESHGVPSFGREAIAPPKQYVKVGTNPARLRSGPCKVSTFYQQLRDSSFFQFFDKQMIAYGFVPVGGPGPAVNVQGCGRARCFRRANTAFPCLAGAGSASEIRWAAEAVPASNEPPFRHVQGRRDRRSPAGFLLPDKICR